MHLDVLDLNTFYYRTRLGRAAQKMVRNQVLSIWPEASRQTLVGFGFAVPLLRPYLPDARRVLALMPGQQGVMPWPAGSANVSVLCEETLWPIETGRADKLIVLHGLETSERPSLLLDECHRVLGPGGRALFIVPNCAGLWARRDRTPYGFGRPYTLTQLETQLGRHGFEPERHAVALFQPPTEQRFWLRTGPFWERAGQRISNRYAGGVLLVEAVKHAHTPIRSGVSERVRRPLRVLDPMPQTGGRPA